MDKVIITGPTGAVGLSLIHELVNHGVRIFAVCRPNSSRIANIPNDPLVEIIECDLTAIKELPSLISLRGFSAFYHLAWDGTSGVARQDWPLQASNITYATDAAMSAKELGCAVFVGVGSQSEYGHVDGVLHPYRFCNPDNGYGAAKLAASEMTRAYCRTNGMRHEWCRILSLYGPGDGAHTMIMQVISKLLKGDRVSCTKGEQVWDYIYGKDAAVALRLIAERGTDGAIYNIASGETRELRNYITCIRDIIDPTLEIGFGEIDYYPNQVMHLEADIENLKEDTGFSPTYTFEAGIRETIEDVKSRCS